MIIQNLIATLAIMGFSAAAQARDLPLPHGPEIGALASACGLGTMHGQFGPPLGQTTKAGEYNNHFQSLTNPDKV